MSARIPKATLTEAMAKGGESAKRAFAAMMTMKKIDVAAIEAAVHADA
jgi:predicted 3-demethylubiquinone-9 3-methyltransferase (glyoxalase superfamily)